MLVKSHDFISTGILIALHLQFIIHKFSQHSLFDLKIKVDLLHFTMAACVTTSSIIHSYLISNLTACYALCSMLIEYTICM
jgi:hypothetical protein